MIPQSLIEHLARRIGDFIHPLVDNQKTEVVVEGDASRSVSLAVRLFDSKGNYLIEDQKITEGYDLPGCLISLSSKEAERLHLETIYVDPQYLGHDIGTEFVYHLIEAAREVRFSTVSLVADTDTGIRPYWMKKHNFKCPDPTKPDYLEKEI